jgi:hypothetical protein
MKMSKERALKETQAISLSLSLSLSLSHTYTHTLSETKNVISHLNDSVAKLKEPSKWHSEPH